jgi:Fur family transcriptional regulator, ferric uptake regulator
MAKLHITATQILKQHNLSNTEARRYIINLFINLNRALSHQDIENTTQGVLDRVTIYRTLQILLDNHIIHSVPSNDSKVLYAICNHQHNEAGHNHKGNENNLHVDNHVHFTCTNCNTVTCLLDTEIPEIKLTNNFKVTESQHLLRGLCNNCI